MASNSIPNTLDLSREAKAEFIDVITEIIDEIDEVKAKLTDGEYLQMTNQMMKLHKCYEKLIQTIPRTIVYQRIHHQVRNSNVNRNTPRLPPRTREACLAQGWKECLRCGTFIYGSLKQHQRRQKCVDIQREKEVSALTKKRINDEKGSAMRTLMEFIEVKANVSMERKMMPRDDFEDYETFISRALNEIPNHIEGRSATRIGDIIHRAGIDALAIQNT
jgi:hypothetical protein